jgi:hypothetical protein
MRINIPATLNKLICLGAGFRIDVKRLGACGTGNRCGVQITLHFDTFSLVG